MNEQKLFSKETFIDLFKLSQIDRLQREDELFLIARSLGVEKRFKESLKNYSKLFESQTIMGENQLPTCSNYDIENFNFGSYSVNRNGIFLQNKMQGVIKFSNFPIIPVERYINKETGKEKVKLIYFTENKWNELIIDRSKISINNKLLQLSDYGLNINSINVNNYINYFSDILSLNESKIKKLNSVSHVGWDNKLFIPYDVNGIFDGQESYRVFYNAISSHGNYELWLNTIKNLRQNKYVKLIMATTFASPLIEKLNIPSFIVNVWSSLSGSGKTLICMASMSAWGDPNAGALTLSSNNTQNFYINIASFMNNFTCFFDELQIIKNSKTINFNELIMDLCNGTEKGRLNKESQTREIKTWRNNFLFTNNDKMVKENAGEQIYNRVIDLRIDNKLFNDSPQEIAEIVKNNYGFAGKDYIKYVQKLGFTNIKKMYKECYQSILGKLHTTEKQISSLACLLIADKLVCDCLFKDEQPLTIEDIIEFDIVNDANEIKTSTLAGKFIIDLINANTKKFTNEGYGEVWGSIEDDGDTIKFNKTILCRELEKVGYDFNTVKKDWADIGFLVKNEKYGYQHITSVYGKIGYFVVLTRNPLSS